MSAWTHLKGALSKSRPCHRVILLILGRSRCLVQNAAMVSRWHRSSRTWLHFVRLDEFEVLKILKYLNRRYSPGWVYVKQHIKWPFDLQSSCRPSTLSVVKCAGLRIAWFIWFWDTEVKTVYRCQIARTHSNSQRILPVAHVARCVSRHLERSDANRYLSC